jgi:DNA replication protein DnaC
MSFTPVSLPRMTNKQYEYVEDQAARRNISFNVCPTCASKRTEIVIDGKHTEEYDWPEDATFKLNGVEWACHCNDQINLLRHYILADIPNGYWRLGEKEYWGDPNALAKVKDYLDNWDQYKLNGFGIELYSPRMGVGKTMLASMLAKWLVQKGERVMFVPFKDILGLYKLHEDERYAILDRLRSTPVLILDEVRAGISDAQHAYMAGELEDLLRFRTSGSAVTIVTTNLTPEQLDEEYPRCFSLLSAKQLPIEVDGDDARKNGNKMLVDIELIKMGEIRPIN